MWATSCYLVAARLQFCISCGAHSDASLGPLQQGEHLTGRRPVSRRIAEKLESVFRVKRGSYTNVVFRRGRPAVSPGARRALREIRRSLGAAPRALPLLGVPQHPRPDRASGWENPLWPMAIHWVSKRPGRSEIWRSCGRLTTLSGARGRARAGRGGGEPSAMKVLLFGDPRLRERARPVDDFDLPEWRAEVACLHQVLRDFRAEHGFGRAIAAPQLGIGRRLIALDLGAGPITLVNPEIVWRSDETFTMWDDCMSFPFLLVRVQRHVSISVRFVDEQGRQQLWERLEADLAELLQHEIDHLDGILATDRALYGDSMVARELFEADSARFHEQVERAYDSARRLVVCRQAE